MLGLAVVHAERHYQGPFCLFQTAGRSYVPASLVVLTGRSTYRLN